MTKLLNYIMIDNSRLFAVIDWQFKWLELIEIIKNINGINILKPMDKFQNKWFDFKYMDYEFNLCNQENQFLLFVKDSSCPENVISDVYTQLFESI